MFNTPLEYITILLFMTSCFVASECYILGIGENQRSLPSLVRFKRQNGDRSNPSIIKFPDDPMEVTTKAPAVQPQPVQRVQPVARTERTEEHFEIHPYIPGGCELPLFPSNGKWDVFIIGMAGIAYQPGHFVTKGTILQYRCNKHYALYPNTPSAYCNKVWSIPHPECIKTCAPIRSTTRMTVKCTRNDLAIDCQTPYEGTQAEVECTSLYEEGEFIRRPYRFCEDGSWDLPLPKCEAICGLKSTEAQPQVIGGDNTTRGEYPWMVGIYLDHNKKHVCGGSIITPEITLTAAHCFEHSQDPNYYMLAAGKYHREYNDARDKDAVFSKIKMLKIHDQFRNGENMFAYDIAIMVVETPFKPSRFVLPVCVDYNARFDEESLVNTKGLVTGWGYTTSADTPSEVLKVLEVNFLSESTCPLPEDLRKFYQLARDKMCAGSTNKGESSCRGDSGGPLIFKRNQRYFMRGIVSLGAKDKTTYGCDSNQVTLFTGVHHHVKLIQQFVTRFRTNESPEGDYGKKSRQKCQEYAAYANTTLSGTLSGGPPKLACSLEYVPQVVGGTKAKGKQFPHSAAIGYDPPGGGSRLYFCSGSLISENFVITAGHCLDIREWGSAKTVRLGDLNLVQTTDDAQPQEYDIAEFVRHPRYRPPSTYNDIMLLRLAQNVKFNHYVRPICLYTADELPTRVAIAADWRFTDDAGKPSDDLLEVTVDLVTQEDCYKSYEPNRRRLKNGIVKESQICAELRLEMTGICLDDSGGPLKIYNSDVECMYSLVGIKSFGKVCGVSKISAVYTRVSHYIDWIEKTVWP